MTARRLLALGALVLALAPTLGPTAAHAAADGSIEIQLLEAPESRRDDPRALAYIVDHLHPGDTIERDFAVTNHTDRRQRVRLYAGPAEIRDGQFIGDEAGTSNELTSWVSVSRSRVRLAPGETTEQTVRVEVPPDAARGERYAVLWAAVRSHGGGDVRLVNRVGIRLYLDVGRGGEPPSDFSVDEIVPGRNASGQPTLTAQVTNTGERAIDVRGEVRLRRGPGGLSAGPFEVASGATLAPGDRGSVAIALDKSLPAGPWRAKFLLRSGRVVHRAAATVTFPTSGTGAAVTPRDADPTDAASGTGSPWTDPWVIGTVTVGLGLLLALLLLRRRRRVAAAPPAPGGGP
ncbi:hypothetical protein [Nocardioides marmoribigeumensis]|uniref:Peptidase n=1 Tax=Nocardioides marmoribigeumensis TaxID=433649 RepID=A0ABU2BTU2_9ACTN|nr:hypothetical protein [Nocardioides marmoribigeumensis]MDR7361183.1 hypothetical protein [Nocardioides marmoribigeumensis]